MFAGGLTDLGFDPQPTVSSGFRPGGGAPVGRELEVRERLRRRRGGLLALQLPRHQLRGGCPGAGEADGVNMGMARRDLDKFGQM